MLENLNNEKSMSIILVLFTFVILFKMHEREDTVTVKQLTFTDTQLTFTCLKLTIITPERRH